MTISCFFSIEEQAEKRAGNDTGHLGQTGAQGCFDGGLHGFHSTQHRENDPGGGNTVEVHHRHGNHHSYGTFCGTHADPKLN